MTSLRYAYYLCLPRILQMSRSNSSEIAGWRCGKKSHGCVGKAELRGVVKIYSRFRFRFSRRHSHRPLHSESLQGLLPACRLKFRGMRARFKCQVPDARENESARNTRRISIWRETDVSDRASNEHVFATGVFSDRQNFRDQVRSRYAWWWFRRT